jgi:hypothetical protein
MTLTAAQIALIARMSPEEQAMLPPEEAKQALEVLREELEYLDRVLIEEGIDPRILQLSSIDVTKQ